MTTTILTATAATAINALLVEQKATPVANINDISDNTIITDVKFFDKEGDLIKRLFLFGTPTTDEIEAKYDLFLGNILKKGGGHKKYENGSIIFVDFKSISSLKREFENEEWDEFDVRFLSRYSEKNIIRYFKKIMK